MLKKYFVCCDGGSRGNPGPAASAFVINEGDKEIYRGSKFIGINTNNVAEYEAVVLALECIVENLSLFKNSEIVFTLDSELIVKQMNGLYKIKNDKLVLLNKKVKSLLEKINEDVVFRHVYREKNKIADFLVNVELDNHF